MNDPADPNSGRPARGPASRPSDTWQKKLIDRYRSKFVARHGIASADSDKMILYWHKEFSTLKSSRAIDNAVLDMMTLTPRKQRQP